MKDGVRMTACEEPPVDRPAAGQGDAGPHVGMPVLEGEGDDRALARVLERLRGQELHHVRGVVDAEHATPNERRSHDDVHRAPALALEG